MSAETISWLNLNTLIGNTAQRGNAWHYKADEQGEESNHYEGAIPVNDVIRRLFHWQPVSVPFDFMTSDGLIIADPTRQVIVRSDTSAVMGVFKSGYVAHPYEEWLVNSVSNILGDTLGISSAGLLKGGAQGWVEVSVPDTISTPEGVLFRPNLLGCTSLDGSLATTFKRTVTATVCDNTLRISLGEDGGTYKRKHTANSAIDIKDARVALGMVHETEELFTAQIKELCETTVTDDVWKAFLAIHVPIPEEKGRAQTMAENKKGAFLNLWNNDNRVSPWKNTAFGVLQADNTYRHHIQPIRGTVRAERNTFAALNGSTDTDDALVMATLGKVLASV